MNNTPLVRPASPRETDWLAEVTGTIDLARAALRKQQRHDEPHGCGTTEDTGTCTADFVLLLAFFEQFRDERIALAANTLAKSQATNGLWGDVNTSVRAYLALKIAGHPATAPHMQRAATAILAHGGIPATDTLTRFFLALLGQIPYSACPVVRAETILLPRWLRAGALACAAWERPVRVLLGILDAHQPCTQLSAEMGIAELLPHTLEPRRGRTRTWQPLRARAVRKSLNWVRKRYAHSDGLAASFYAIALNAIVLRAIGVPQTDAELRWVWQQLDGLCVRENDSLSVQPLQTPVSDTALSLIALSGAKQPATVALEWLLEREVRTAGDWRATASDTEPSGWCAQYANGFYPDVATTANVLLAFARTGFALREASSGAVHRALNWLLALQNRDGGWGAFDRGLRADPSCPAITASVLETLGHFGFRVGQPIIDAAVRFVLSQQTDTGEWVNRWQASAIETTSRVFAGLRAVQFDVYSLAVRRAVRWYRESQNEDGGWGAESTPTETAWAVLAMLAVDEGTSEESRAGAEFLVGTQHGNGEWNDTAFTATHAAPNILRRSLFPLCWPLLALTRYFTECVNPTPPTVFTRTDAGHASASAPKTRRHTLAE